MTANFLPKYHHECAILSQNFPLNVSGPRVPAGAGGEYQEMKRRWNGNSWLSIISLPLFFPFISLCISVLFVFLNYPPTFSLAVIFPVCEFEETLSFFLSLTRLLIKQNGLSDQVRECVIAALLPVDIKNNNSFDTKSGSEFPGDVD